MPYESEFASGHTLAQLVNSQAVRDFDGEIWKSDPITDAAMPTALHPIRDSGRVRSLVVFDGSTTTSKVMNGHPGAEASLLNIAVVVIHLESMRNLPTDPIPGPADIRKLEDCHTLSAVLPGCNVIGKAENTDTPKRFFRHIVNREISGVKLTANHESLLDTLRCITNDRSEPIRCPGDGCEYKVTPGSSATHCGECGELIHPTDCLRAHERFEDYGSSEQAFTTVRTAVEHLALINVIRWLEQNEHLGVLDSVAFIMDGPLAIFGMAAWLKKHIQDELARIHDKALSTGGSGLLVMGIEKHGMFMDHMEALDWSSPSGIRSRIAPGTVLAPDLAYIHQHITLRPLDAKPHGSATYYGRKLMYKTHSGQHTVFTLPIINNRGRNPHCVDVSVYPRAGDALDLVDELGTYLYKDGFAPLVRAHMHAAIPLRMGTEILKSLFADKR